MLLDERAKDPPTCWKELARRTGYSVALLDRIWRTERWAQDVEGALAAAVSEFSEAFGAELQAVGRIGVVVHEDGRVEVVKADQISL